MKRQVCSNSDQIHASAKQKWENPMSAEAILDREVNSLIRQEQQRGQ